MQFKEEIAKLIPSVPEAINLLEVPPNPALGDYAFPCFILAKEEKKSPVEVAKELAETLEADFLDKIEAKGPYVNFFIKPDKRAATILANITEEYGKQDKKDGRVMVEYSQPNSHKAFHVGHLRGTSLGEALSRILTYTGYDVTQANYSGDTGAHIAKWLWYYTTKDKSEPPTEPHELETWIAQMYVKAIQELDEDPEAQEEVDKILLELDERRPGELLDIYKKTRQWSIDAFNAIYNDLHAHFDVWIWESEIEEPAKRISKELVEKGIAKVDDGATIIDLEDENLGVWVLLRKDGTALYSAKDLALAEKKYEEYGITNSIYCVGAAQATHLQQLFATLKRMEFTEEYRFHHLSFAEVRLPEGKMSSRTGKNILYSDMRQQVHEYAAQEVRKRHEEWSDEQVEAIASQVVVAALKYDMLAIQPGKNITFDPKKATQFEGETGPYLQYTYARACGILEKAGTQKHGNGTTLLHEKEQALLRQLATFPATVDRAAKEYQPSHIANYTMQLAKAFNSFYHDCPVLSAEDTLKRDRLALVEKSVLVLGKALDLLAIDAPEEM